MNKRNKGFTLIELMIVVAIIGILAAVAIPSYQDYNTRAQVSEAATLTSSIKTALADHFASNGTFNALPAPATLGVSTQGKYITSIGFAGASGGTVFIQATMKSAGINAAIQGKIFGLETGDGGNTWLCGNQATNSGNNIDSRFLPSSCK